MRCQEQLNKAARLTGCPNRQNQQMSHPCRSKGRLGFSEADLVALLCWSHCGIYTLGLSPPGRSVFRYTFLRIVFWTGDRFLCSRRLTPPPSAGQPECDVMSKQRPNCGR